MNRHRITGLLLFSVFTASAIAEEWEFPAQPPDVVFGTAALDAAPMLSPMSGMAGTPGMPFNLVMLAEQLDLTKDQRDQAGKIVDEATPKLRALMFRMIDARKAGKELKSGAATDQALRKHADEQGEIVSELTYLGLKARADLRALLTEEQRKKLDSFTEGRGPFFIQRFGAVGGFDPARLPALPNPGQRELKI